MKSNKFLLACILLLAIFTIGAACASENVTQDDEAAAESDDLSLENDSSDVLGGESYYDDDFYITVEENYSQDIDDWDSNELVYISSYSQKNGTVKVSVDDVEKKTYDITEGYFSVEDDGYGGTYNRYYQYIYPKDLGIENCGTYNVKVRFNDNLLINSSVTMTEREDFDIWLQNPYYCEQDYWEVPSLIIIDSNHFNTGTLEIFVNGTRKITYAVNNGSFEEISNCSNRSRYVAPSDLFDGYGNYRVLINFTENGATRTLKDEEVVIGEFPPTTDPKLEIYFEFYDLYLRADVHAYIYLPREATGNLSITFKSNGQTFSVPYSKGYASYYIHDYLLNYLGENEVVIKYVGDDFPSLDETSGFINVHPGISIPSYVDLNEEFSISLTVYDWVNGDFEVYEYDNGTKGNLVASSSIRGGHSTVTLSGNTSGLNKYFLHIDTKGSGVYDIVKEVYVVKNSGNITADVPSEIEAGSNLTVTVTAPDIDWTFVQIKVYSRETEFVLVENGRAVRNITELGRGYHTVTVLYDNRMFDENGDLVGDVYRETFNVNVGVMTNLTASDVTCDYNSSANLTVTLKDANGNALSGNVIQVTLGGTNYTETTDNNGQARFAIVQEPGNYTAEISFVGAAGYLSSSASASVNVNKVRTFIYTTFSGLVGDDGKNIYIVLTDQWGNYLPDKNITVCLNGNAYNRTTDSRGGVFFTYDLLPGNYTATFSFAGDEKYLNSSGSKDIEVFKQRIDLVAPDSIRIIYAKNESFDISFQYPVGYKPFANAKVIMNLSGTDYNCTTNEHGYLKVPFSIPFGNYSASFRLVEDQKYELSGKVVEINVIKAKSRFMPYSIHETYGVGIELTFALYDSDFNELSNRTVVFTLNNETDFTNVTDESGLVRVYFPFKVGEYNLTVVFGGDGNYLNSSIDSHFTFKRLEVNLTATDVVAVCNSNATLTVTLKDIVGNPLKSKEIIVMLGGMSFNETTDSNGQVTIPVSLTGGNYVANVFFNGDDVYNVSSVNASVTVNKIDSKLTASPVSTTYNIAKNLVVTLKDADGKALQAKTVIVKLNGKTYAPTTDGNGQVRISVNLPAKTYTAVISFAGDGIYAASGATAKVVVSKAKPKLTAKSKTFKVKAKTKKVTATLKDNKGRAMKNVKLTLKIKGKKYTAKTNKKGIATFKVKLTKKGTYSAKIAFKANSNYDAASKTIKIKIK